MEDPFSKYEKILRPAMDEDPSGSNSSFSNAPTVKPSALPTHDAPRAGTFASLTSQSTSGKRGSFFGSMSLEEELGLSACLPDGESLHSGGSNAHLDRLVREHMASRAAGAASAKSVTHHESMPPDGPPHEEDTHGGGGELPAHDRGNGAVPGSAWDDSAVSDAASQMSSSIQSEGEASNVSPPAPSTSAAVVRRAPGAGSAVQHPELAGRAVSINAAFDSSGIFPLFQNIVSTVDLGTRLDLQRIALHARNAEYNPKRFSAVIMRIRDPRTTALVFSSGKMVCTGARSEELSRLAARKFARIIQKLGFDELKFRTFRIQNMVATVDVKFPIRLESLVMSHAQFCTFEPELFPGVIYRMIKPRVCLLIFVSGKVVLTGAKMRSDIQNAVENIYPILRSFRKQ